MSLQLTSVIKKGEAKRSSWFPCSKGTKGSSELWCSGCCANLRLGMKWVCAWQSAFRVHCSALYGMRSLSHYVLVPKEDNLAKDKWKMKSWTHWLHFMLAHNKTAPLTQTNMDHKIDVLGSWMCCHNTMSFLKTSNKDNKHCWIQFSQSKMIGRGVERVWMLNNQRFLLRDGANSLVFWTMMTFRRKDEHTQTFSDTCNLPMLLHNL